MHRLFVALPCPDAWIEALENIQHGIDGARWVPSENFHCTLRFIGEVDGRRADDLVDALKAIRGAPIDLSIDGVGVFDHRNHGQLWARIVPKAPTEALHGKVDRACVRAGMEPERRAFVPHLTLARWSRGPIDHARWGERFAGLALPSQRFDCFALYESRLGRDGPDYDRICDFPLHVRGD